MFVETSAAMAPNGLVGVSASLPGGQSTCADNDARRRMPSPGPASIIAESLRDHSR